MSAELIEQTFKVETPAQLKVSNIRGSVDIRPGEEGVIAVTAEKKGTQDGTQIIIEQLEDGQVVVEAKHENSVVSWFGLNKPSRVDFTIRVPKACSVKVNGVSCEIVIEGLEGQIDVNGVSGDLKLNDLSGEFDFSNVSGEITAHNLTGPLDLNTVSGKVQIKASHIPALHGKTVSGGVSVETALADGPYEFKSVSGNLTLLPPEDQGCVVNIKSISGNIRTSMPVTARQGHGPNRQITILDGGPEINVKSVSGIVRIGEKSESVETSEARVASVRTAEPPKSQMQILDEIDRGELSVDEAIKLMNP